MVDMIVPLSSKEATLDLVGGKGANLAELTRAGFVVPPGSLVTTDAYRLFTEHNGIAPRILELVGTIQVDDPVALEKVSDEIRRLFAEGTMPADLERRISAAYEKITDDQSSVPVAVRSSATAEDLPGLSFAGQQDTYLNIVGVQALLDAVKKCWGSLWTARAIDYRARNRIASDEVALAVVVQRMIASEVSGVLFTANPLTGRRDEIVIDASYGLGEAIVSGQVEPDNYTVNGRDGKITNRRIGAKALAVVPRAGGGTDQIQRMGDQKQALPDAQIVELAKISQKIAAHFGSPQDIEWAWANNQLYILQSRPITSLYPLPPKVMAFPNLHVYLSLNSVQGVPEPFTPLSGDGFQFFATGLYQVVGIKQLPDQALMLAGDRLFADMTSLLGDARLRQIAFRLLSGVDPAAKQVITRLIAEGRVPEKRVMTPGRMLKLGFRLRAILFRMWRAWLQPEQVRKRAVADADRYLEELQSKIRAANTLAEKVTVLETQLPTLVSELFFKTLMASFAPAIISMGIVERWLIAWAGAKSGSVLPLLRGMPGNVTTEMDLYLWSTAQAIRADPAAQQALKTQPVEALTDAYLKGTLPATAQRAIGQFLDRYGMRAVGEIDMGRPRWRENPRQIIQTLSSYLDISDPNLAPDKIFQKGAADAERLADEYIAQVRRTSFGSVRARLLKMMIRCIRVLAGLRESPKFYMIRVLDSYRTAFLQSGQELAAKGQLQKPEDIFFVPVADLKRFARGESVDLKEVVAARRVEYERELARRQIPRVLLSTGEAFFGGVEENVEGKDENDLIGEGVSPGVVEGRVRVVLDPHGVRLEPGEILVCPATDPGWTPLFLSAGGLVMELGGLVTHGSVVAREYGIPAVVGVREVTSRLKTGQQVRVDGSHGTVTVLEAVAEPV